MQSGTSCFNKTIFKKNITHFWPIWGIYLVFLLYALPLTLLLSTENPGTGAKAAKQIAEDNLARYTTCLGGALTPMFVFVAQPFVPGPFFLSVSESECKHDPCTACQ